MHPAPLLVILTAGLVLFVGGVLHAVLFDRPR